MGLVLHMRSHYNGCQWSLAALLVILSSKVETATSDVQ